MSAKEKLLAFIRHAGEVFGFEELAEADFEFEVNRVEDPDYPFYCTDLAREETGEVFRFCLLENAATLEETLDYYFARYRELEEDYAGDFEGATLLLRPDGADDENPDFFYIFRTDSGEVGLFHSVLSIDDEDEDEEDDEDDEDGLDEDKDEEGDEDKANGKREVGGV